MFRWSWIRGVTRRRLLGLVLAAAGVLVLVASLAASPDHLHLDSDGGLWSLALGLVLLTPLIAARAHHADGLGRALSWAVAAELMTMLALILGAQVLGWLTPRLDTNATLSDYAIAVAECGLVLVGLGAFCWSRGVSNGDSNSLWLVVYLGVLVGGAGTRYPLLSEDAGAYVVYAAVVAGVIGVGWYLARRLQARRPRSLS